MHSTSEKLQFLSDFSVLNERIYILSFNSRDAGDSELLKFVSQNQNFFSLNCFHPVSVSGRRLKNCFTWRDFNYFELGAQNEITYQVLLSGGFIYDLEKEEYVLDFAAEKV